MEGLTLIISIGDGSHMVVMYHHLTARSFWIACGASIGHLLVIQSFAIMSNHCFVLFLRYYVILSILVTSELTSDYVSLTF
jgi:hypothetical protein